MCSTVAHALLAMDSVCHLLWSHLEIQCNILHTRHIYICALACLWPDLTRRRAVFPFCRKHTTRMLCVAPPGQGQHQDRSGMLWRLRVCMIKEAFLMSLIAEKLNHSSPIILSVLSALRYAASSVTCLAVRSTVLPVLRKQAIMWIWLNKKVVLEPIIIAQYWYHRKRSKATWLSW